MPRSRLVLLVPVVLFLIASPLVAQQVTPGARIRVSRPCVPGEYCPLLNGRFVSWHGSTVRLTAGDGDQREVEVVPGSKVEVFRGSRGHAVTGLLVGTLAGGVIGAVAAKDCDQTGTYLDGVCGGASIVGGVLLGALGGLAIGAFSRSERWDPVTPPALSLGVLANGRGVGVRWRF